MTWVAPPDSAAADRERMISRLSSPMTTRQPGRARALLTAWVTKSDRTRRRAALTWYRRTSEDRHHRSRYALHTGLELLTVLHEQEPELPVILLTSHGHLDMHLDATQQRRYAYLRKPVDVHPETVLASALADYPGTHGAASQPASARQRGRSAAKVDRGHDDFQRQGTGLS